LSDSTEASASSSLSTPESINKRSSEPDDSSETFLQTGVKFAQKGNFQAAEQSWLQGAKADPEDGVFMMNLGVLNMNWARYVGTKEEAKEKISSAAEYLGIAMELSPPGDETAKLNMEKNLVELWAEVQKFRDEDLSARVQTSVGSPPEDMPASPASQQSTASTKKRKRKYKTVS